jgi:hypothetical protein
VEAATSKGCLTRRASERTEITEGALPPATSDGLGWVRERVNTEEDEDEHEDEDEEDAGFLEITVTT